MALPTVADWSTKELVDAQAHIWNRIYNYINSLSLKSAIQLGIPDVIHKHGKPMTLSQLAEAIPINKAKSRGLHSLMRILVHSKFFDKIKISKDDDDEEEAYCLTQASLLLLRDEPLSLAPFILGVLNPIMIDSFHCMAEWFQNEDPSPFFTKNGRTASEYAGIDQNWNQLFNKAMASDARFVANILVKECKQVFEGLKTMVDVGGGTGMVAKAIADAFPGLKCIVLELPHVVDGLEGSENLSFVGGDMFESIPHADAIFIKWTLNMLTDEECVKILEKCKEAINPSKNDGGKVIIVDTVVDDQQDYEATETQLFWDMHVMSRFASGERTEKEWAKVFCAAGFTRYKAIPVLGLRSVIEVYP